MPVQAAPAAGRRPDGEVWRVTLTRRDLIKMGVLVSGAVALPLERTVSALTTGTNQIAESALPKPFTIPFAVPPTLRPVRRTATTDFFKIAMRPFEADVIPGYKTVMWGYNSSYPGPTINADVGRRTVIRHLNQLPPVHPVLKYKPYTSVHLHGMPSLPPYDGYASDITNPGWYKDYIYPNTHPASTFWYHDHGVQHTAENVSMGLVAQYHLHDALERSLPIPHGAFGNVFLVNGRPWPLMKVHQRKYRFRLLNASVSRSYRFELDSGTPFTMIATDAGLMPHPVDVTSFRVGMAERYEFVLDFSKFPVGRHIVMRNVSPKNNIDFTNTDKVMAFEVVGGTFDTRNNAVPDSLNPQNETMLLKQSQSVITRPQELKRTNGQWTIDGFTWEDVVASNFKFCLAKPVTKTVEIWELSNPHGGWFHPVHIHLIDFRVLDRNGRPPFAYERGPKDVVYVGENETVRVLIKFRGRGRYMTHCHNLVHEDHDMMGQFDVIDPNHAELSPFARPAKPLPEKTQL